MSTEQKESLKERIDWLEMTGEDPQMLVWLLELRRHRENNWQQRAEAAEKERDRRIADYKRLIDQHMPRTIDGCDEGWSRVIEAHELQTKLEAAEAKLAELEKQDPAGYAPKGHINRYLSGKNSGCWIFGEPTAEDNEPLFTRPAPAINLAELAPDFHVRPISTDQGPAWIECGADYPRGRHFFTRAAILRNIEESKQ